MVGEEYAKYFADAHAKAKKYTEWAKTARSGDRIEMLLAGVHESHGTDEPMHDRSHLVARLTTAVL
jgi:hypothetical protein